MSSIVTRLFEGYRSARLPMAYTMQDFTRDYVRDHLEALSAEERMAGLSPRQIEAYLRRLRKKNPAPKKRAPKPAEAVERLGRLYTAVVADVLDWLGYRRQVMRDDIRPLFPQAKYAGVALTVHTVPARRDDPAEPYKGELAAVDALRPDDVLVVSRCDGSFWGELLSTAARYRGCRGVVIDGQTRDTAAIIAMGFPVFCRGIHCADSRGRLEVVGHNVVIECGGVAVEPGDLVLADHDGIVVVPREAAGQVLAAAEEKVSGENLVRQKLADGMSTTEAFRRYGIL
jgi:regulator of RNase E activity RraA